MKYTILRAIMRRMFPFVRHDFILRKYFSYSMTETIQFNKSEVQWHWQMEVLVIDELCLSVIGKLATGKLSITMEHHSSSAPGSTSRDTLSCGNRVKPWNWTNYQYLPGRRSYYLTPVLWVPSVTRLCLGNRHLHWQLQKYSICDWRFII